MLQAVLNGKAGRIERGGEAIRWRELFKRSEDLLTATIFGRLPYLSDEVVTALMELLIGDQAAATLSPFDQLELWPRLCEWDARVYVEPDVILCFERELVIIEVKPPFGGSQYQGQWRAQISALEAEEEYRDYERIYFVALGNTLPATLPATVLPERFAPMRQLEWEPLRRFVQTHPVFDERRQDAAIRQDWLQAFELFGMLPLVPGWQPLLDYASGLDLAQGFRWLPATPSLPAINRWEPLLAFAGGLNLDSTLVISPK